MTLVLNGGAALPVNVVADGRPMMAMVAYPVRTFVGETDGRNVVVLPMGQPVVYVSKDELDVNGGKYHLSPLRVATPIITDLGLLPNAGPAVAVYEA